jgi:LmbE family N-acetylglucosaminyl deacetylase
MANDLGGSQEDELPRATSVLAVCAHPDDESFGLGAVLAAFADAGSSTAVLCFTHGETSALGSNTSELGRIRAAELADAATELGIHRVELFDYPDGGLSQQPLDQLTEHVRQVSEQVRADLLLVFDEGGVTGHLDHGRATEAAFVFAQEAGLPVLAWAMSEPVADSLNTELGTRFIGRAADQLDLVVHVDRRKQHKAISRHTSQATGNRVLWRRLELQGDDEAFRWLRPPSGRSSIGTTNRTIASSQP